MSKQDWRLFVFYMMIIILTLLLTACQSVKQIDDTEHRWIGNDGETFYD